VKRKSLVDDAATRKLAVLTDGPWRGRWYWVDDLEATQESARRYLPEHPSGQLQSYVPTSRRVTHPDEPMVSGTAYTYRSAA
jgi:hypothetical protein